MRRSPATSASARVQTLRSADVAHDCSISSAPTLRARAVLERELLQFAQQPLLALADLGDERLGAVAVELQVERPGLLGEPLRQVPGLHVDLGGDLAAGLLHRLVEPGGRLVAALLAGEERDREGLRVGTGERLRHGLDLGLLPALDAVGDHEAAAHRERHRAQRAGDVVRRAGVALVDLDAGRARGGLGHRPQPGAPLGDAAVVVAVDQVGGAEARHPREVRGGAGRHPLPPVLRRGRREREGQRLGVGAGPQALVGPDRLLEAERHAAVGHRRVPAQQRQRAVIGPQRGERVAVRLHLQRLGERVRAVDQAAGGVRARVQDAELRVARGRGHRRGHRGQVVGRRRRA